MYAAVEARANVLCAAIFLAIVLIGKMFGGSLWGLFPLGACIASGVFLWMKDLVRQGRNVEWSSEQKRGETAVVNLIPESVEWLNTAVGLIWGLINPDMFAAVGHFDLEQRYIFSNADYRFLRWLILWKT